MEPKKPGARDLSDLKAKLGLLKPGQPAGLPASPPGRPPQPGMVGRMPAAAPASAPAQETNNPFAKVAPRPVARSEVISDAGPLLDVPDAPRSKVNLAIFAGFALVLMVMAYWWGGVYRSRGLYNRTTQDAVQIKEQIEGIRKKTQAIFLALESGSARAKQDPKLKIFDPQVVAELKQLQPLTAPKTDKIFRTNYAMFENVAIDRLFNFYNDTIRLFGAVDRFVRHTENAKEDLMKERERTGGEARTFGVVVDGSGPIPIATLVEIGTPVCKKGVSEQECAQNARNIEGFKIRSDFTAPWSDRRFKGKGLAAVKPDTSLASKVLAGGIGKMAANQYKRELGEIIRISHELVKGEKQLLEQLTKTATRSELFTF